MTPPGLEDTLVEQPAIALLEQIGWNSINAFHMGPGTLGRETTADVVLVPHLRAALEKLNPNQPKVAVDLAIEELSRDRSAMGFVQANREVYGLLKDGVKVTVRSEENDTDESTSTIQVIDWNVPSNNDYLVASQLWVSGEMYKRRTDLVGFVNGLPLVFIELKASHKRLENAYNDNLRDYKNTIPQLFWYNALVILSNGSKSRIGTISSQWEHFAEWKKINSEGEQGLVSLETMLRGTCTPEKLLDIVENFALFDEAKGGLVKLVGKNHQVLGVNNAIHAVHNLKENQGRLGVFWHTQGSGKSYSMAFFCQKILRTVPGNWTFLIVTDRQELDDQIYKTFANIGAVTEKQAQATSGEDLKRLLREDHRYVFTLIQKFRTDKGEKYPVLSDRSDIIVVTDEAHRSQYDTLALNMRNALPNAAFIGFTGTPLMAGEEKTREVFGDYVSVYNFKQSVLDGATVPIYYENRIPELQLINEKLNEDMAAILDSTELEEDQEKKLEQEFAREYHLIARDDRLEKVAEDLVAHFMGRGHHGKAMVVSIDKACAVRMYDKVQKYWKRYLEKLKKKRGSLTGSERDETDRVIAFMETTDMAVVVSQAQNEVEDFKAKGLDIKPHRKRMVEEDLETKFKESDDPLRIVFVCAMWLTGFDVPSCSTIYLDKPMRNHTLMQTIARANRVFKDKVNGLIVDYIGVFRDLKKALAIYGTASGGGADEGDSPVQPKAELVDELKTALLEITTFCTDIGIDVPALEKAFADTKSFLGVALIDEAVEKILVNEETKKKFFALVASVNRLYKAILPDDSANQFARARAIFKALAERIRSELPPTDISDVMNKVEALLDRSVASESYVIREAAATYATTDHLIDLSGIDFDALRAFFEKGRKRMATEKLKAALANQLDDMVRQNRTRMDFQEKFQTMLDEYNAGSLNVEEFFKQLLNFAQKLNDEQKRGIAEQLEEEELALFDLLTKPEIELTSQEVKDVKRVARELIQTLNQKYLVLDWRKRQQARAAVRVAIETVLDQLPETFSKDIFEEKCDKVYQHIYDAYQGQGQSIYRTAS